MYITLSEYTALYDMADDRLFNRLAVEACKLLDKYTTGCDGVKKLSIAFPTENDDAQAVKHCAAKIVSILHQIEQADAAANQSRGYMSTSNGLQGKVIASVTSGNESVTYSTSAVKSSVDAAVVDFSAREKMIRATIRDYLSGTVDANGVNLLYMGPYPLTV
jgi:hypothetical protein